MNINIKDRESEVVKQFVAECRKEAACDLYTVLEGETKKQRMIKFLDVSFYYFLRTLLFAMRD